MKKQRKKTKKDKKVVNNNLHQVFEKRTGGAIAIKGFNFQFLYACYIILLELSDESIENSIRLEGIEDIDICHKNEFIQLKSSINPIDANKFWNMGVLKNYLEVYEKDFSCSFRFVHDTTIVKGNLKGLESKRLNSKTLKYWSDKVRQLQVSKDINIQEFLQKITFERIEKGQIFSKCKQLLLQKFDLNNDTEEQFLFALLQHIHVWSEQRKTVAYDDVLQVIQLVKDASYKTPINEAIKKNLITPISFETIDDATDLGYFDGKSAKPVHIALGLPVERKYWQKKIQESLEEYGVTVIKSSSGQGKSTLAWKVAYDFKKLGFDIYQLNYAENYENLEEIFDFIQTRIKIGQLPLIVIDGLDKRVDKWGNLAERLFDFPVKIVVTTREEDWYRYGIDVSKAKLNLIDIHFLRNEAKSIFLQLKIKNKLQEDIKTWEPIWEKIESKGLLIEYVYLLTHGTMIHERLAHQVKQLNKNGNDASAKIEILRIISLADILNIKVQTKKLTKYIQESIGFQSDRGELYKVLEKEYYLQFDKKYIEGLHPVRSQHLVDILHKTLPIDESLISLLGLIDDNFIHNFFLSIPYLMVDKEEFLKESTKIVKEKSFNIIVDAIDGLMHFEPYNYWKNNRKIYDDIFNRGLIEAFVYFNLPFSDLQTLEEMNKVFKTDSSEYIVKQKNNLIPFSFEKTFVSKFCLYISEQLFFFKLDKTKSYKGLAYLAKWLNIVNANIPKLSDFEDTFLLQEFKEKDLEEVIELYIFLYILYPKKYLAFITKYKPILFSILKEKTDSLIVFEENNEIYIKYLADNENMDKLNECSVQRIDIFKDIFPYYVRFNTEAIYLPFPNEELYKLMIQNSIKSIPKDNLIDKFDVHLNVIWRKAIMRQYSYESVYEWQKHQIDIRLKILEFIKNFNKAFENILKKKKIKNIGNIENEINLLLSHDKEFLYNEEDKLKNELKNVNSFKTSFSNFINQLVSIIEDRFSNKSKLALLNLKNANFELSNMQKSFRVIENNTYQYFETENIIQEELYWFDRFIKTVSFYIHTSEQKVVVAKDSIYKWWEEFHKKELDQIYTILQDLDYYIYKPLKVIEQVSSREVVIGIEGFEEGDLEQILFGLVDFYKLDIDVVNIIRVHNKEASYGFGIPKLFFEKVQNVLDGGEYEESEFGNPYPINVTEELLLTLDEKIFLETPPENIPQTAFIEIMIDIWKLMEYRNNLNVDNEVENKWLQENEKNIINKIREKIDKLSSDEITFVSQIIDEERNIAKNEIVDLMNEKIGLKYKEQS